MVSYKQLCARCKKQFVLISGNQFPVCYDCQKKELSGEIKDPKMKKMFKLPEELYMNNPFLRDIKAKYLRFGNLTDKQIEAFKRVSKELLDASLKKSTD